MTPPENAARPWPTAPWWIGAALLWTVGSALIWLVAL